MMEKMTATISTQIRQAAMMSWAVAVMNLGLEVNIFLTARILAILLVLVVRAEYISDMEVPGRILNRIQKSFKCKRMIGDGLRLLLLEML